MKKFFYWLSLSLFFLLGGCKNDDTPIQQEESLPTLEEMEIAYIAEESLNGWDAGISFKGGYCVGKRDTIDGTSTLHFNFPNSDADNGITMVFNKEGNIMNIIYANNFFIVNDDNNYTHYTQMDDEGKIIGSYKYNSRLKDDKDSRGLADLGDQLIKMTSKEFMKCCIDGAGYGLDLRDILNNNTSQSVVDGNYRAFLLFSGFAVAGLAAAAGGASLPVLAAIIIADLAVDKILDARYESARANLYGDTEVSIINVSKDDSYNYTVVLEITNANTIPSKYYEWFGLKEYDNTVECGVVASKTHISLPSVYNHEAITNVLLHPNISRRRITVTLPKNYYQTITFRPFLITEREYENKDKYLAYSRGKYVRYGNAYTYNNTNQSAIISCETISAYYESDKVQFKGYVEPFVHCKENEKWGVYFRTQNGSFGHFEAQGINLTRSLVQFTPSINDLNLDFFRWEATYITDLGIYHVDNKGNYTYGEMKKCRFVYDTPPSIKFTNARILGTREENNENGSRAAPGPGGDGDEDEDEDEDEDDDDDDKKSYITSFTQTFDVKGSLWINRINYVKDEGSPTFESEAGQPMADKSYTTKGTISYKAKTPNLSAITRYSITLRNGNQLQMGVGYYKNRLYWSGENKITDVDWE